MMVVVQQLIDVFLQKGDRKAITRLVLASSIPLLASALYRTLRTTVDVLEHEPALWLQLWLAGQEDAVRRTRQLVMHTSGQLLARGRGGPGGRLSMPMGGQAASSDKEEGRDGAPKLAFVPAAGAAAYFWYGGRPISVRTSTESGTAGPWSQSKEVRFTITVYGAARGEAIAAQLVLEARQLWVAKQAEQTSVWIYDDRDGQQYRRSTFRVLTKPSRPMSTVIVERGEKEKLLADAERFLESEARPDRSSLARGFVPSPAHNEPRHLESHARTVRAVFPRPPAVWYRRQSRALCVPSAMCDVISRNRSCTAHRALCANAISCEGHLAIPNRACHHAVVLSAFPRDRRGTYPRASRTGAATSFTGA